MTFFTSIPGHKDQVNWATKSDYPMDALDLLRAAHHARMGGEHMYADDYGFFEDESEARVAVSAGNGSRYAHAEYRCIYF